MSLKASVRRTKDGESVAYIPLVGQTVATAWCHFFRENGLDILADMTDIGVTVNAANAVEFVIQTSKAIQLLVVKEGAMDMEIGRLGALIDLVGRYVGPNGTYVVYVA